MTAHFQNLPVAKLGDQALLKAVGIKVIDPEVIGLHKHTEMSGAKTPTKLGVILDRLGISPEFANRYYGKFAVGAMVSATLLLISVVALADHFDWPSVVKTGTISVTAFVAIGTFVVMCATAGQCIYPAKWVMITWTEYDDLVPVEVEQDIGKVRSLGYEVMIEDLKQGEVTLDPIAWVVLDQDVMLPFKVWKGAQVLNY